MLSDDSGFLFMSSDTTLNLIIWKYQPSATTCQNFQSLTLFSYGQVKIDDYELFFLASDSSSLHLSKFTFGGTTTDWSIKMNCNTNPCLLSNSESLFNSSSKTIHSFSIYQNPQLLFYTAISSPSGSVIGTRSKSSSSWALVTGSAQTSQFLITNLSWGSSILLILDTVSSQFTLRSFSGGLNQATN